jgi:tripartite ATP-independent transporter DctP family solute receptor
MKQTFLRTIAGLLVFGAIGVMMTGCSSSEKVITLRGASQFDESHFYTKTLREFERLVKEYYGKPIIFELYLNSELGLEKDYFAYMNQGIQMDYAIVSPSHMSTFARSAPLMDMPFLFEDHAHMERVMSDGALQPLVDEVLEKADVRILGFAGGGLRNLIVNKPVRNLAELRGLAIRVMDAPIQNRIFRAIGANPNPLAYDEIYNAIQTGVIDAAENEAAGIQQMKFYEVGPEISLTQHAISIRPICFSDKTFNRIPEDLQAAIIRAGREAGDYGRQIEIEGDAALLASMQEEGLLNTHTFTNREELLELAEPVKQAYASEIGAADVYDAVNALRD